MSCREKIVEAITGKCCSARLLAAALVLGFTPALSPAQNVDAGCDAHVNSYYPEVRAVAVQTDGKLLVGGDFFGMADADRPDLARLNADCSVDTGFTAILHAKPRPIVVQPDGRIVIGSDFGIMRLNTDGSVDSSFDVRVNGGLFPGISVVAMQPDGKLVIGGSFDNVAANGDVATARKNIARLNPDGSLDGDFDPHADGNFGGKDTGPYVGTLVVQADGKLVLGGHFDWLAPNGGTAVTRHGIARLYKDGNVDSSFDPGAIYQVMAMILQPDGKLVVGGSYFDLPVARNGVARLNADGSIDTGFDPNLSDPNVDAYVSALALQPDGKVVMGGYFTSLAPNGGAAVARNYLARVNADGSLDSDFDPNPDGVIWTMALQPNGKLVLGGEFRSFAPNGGGAVARYAFARLDTDAAIDKLFLDGFD